MHTKKRDIRILYYTHVHMNIILLNCSTKQMFQEIRGAWKLRSDSHRMRKDYKTRDGMKYSFQVCSSPFYSHARSAFDPSAYARNQKATSLTR